jgi:soluble lytic murein transglycosylase-like protein
MAATLESIGRRFADIGTHRIFRAAPALALAALAIGLVLGQVTFWKRGDPVTDATTSASAVPAGPPVPARRGAAKAFSHLDPANVEALVVTTARKYRISRHAMREFVDAAYAEAQRNRLDPLLIVAVMAVESRFNPAAQSDFGATGLMQVIPRYHADKFAAPKGESVLDPRINIRVGARVLKDYVARGGTETAGLQLYNGAPGDARHAYATKVLAERARLREAMRRTPSRAGDV